ncbi:translation initiation factor IF-2-like [Harpia harpyja]|uniref:translation initiation factor IF-2-like n=1 Tax=Harpia harpyja TaxID=202280 RepID=UPI0022B1D44E|nr:translation initiation factor IF-2-like [Harpia harpyja]
MGKPPGGETSVEGRLAPAETARAGPRGAFLPPAGEATPAGSRGCPAPAFAGLGQSSSGREGAGRGGGSRLRGEARGTAEQGAGGGSSAASPGGATPPEGWGRGTARPRAARGAGHSTGWGGRCGGRQPAGRLLGGAAPAPPPPPPAAIQRATAAVSTGFPRSRLSLPEPACAPGRGRPILPVPAGARSPSPPGKGGGGGSCLGNRLLGATRGGGRRGDKHLRGGGMGGNVPANPPCPPPCPGHPPFTASPPPGASRFSVWKSRAGSVEKSPFASHSGSRVWAEFQGVCGRGRQCQHLWSLVACRPRSLSYICAVSRHAHLWLIKTYFPMYS